MKLTYKAQMGICLALVLVGNILTDLFASWIYRSGGFVICGLLWMVHPVVPETMEAGRQAIFWTRIGGVILLLIGIFTRVHYG